MRLRQLQKKFTPKNICKKILEEYDSNIKIVAYVNPENVFIEFFFFIDAWKLWTPATSNIFLNERNRMQEILGDA